jgi:hypothetical protein
VDKLKNIDSTKNSQTPKASPVKKKHRVLVFERISLTILTEYQSKTKNNKI